MPSSIKYSIGIVGALITIFILKQSIAIPPTHTDNYIATHYRSSAMLQYCTAAKEPCSFMPFQHGMANRLWLQAIQYIGRDVYASYHDQLFDRIKDITTLDPYRQYPYIMSQYILPDTTNPDNNSSWQQAIQLGQDGLMAICDQTAIAQVAALSDEDFLDMYYGYNRIVPCPQYVLPQTIGFVAFYYAKDIVSAITYYRVAALAYDAPDILVNMPAIITARYDDDRKSMMMRTNRYESAKQQLNPELDDTDLFFLISTMEHALRKGVHHTFVSLMQEVAVANDCGTSLNCVQEHIPGLVTAYTNQCDSDDAVKQTMCTLLLYAQEQGWINNKGQFVYPLDPETPEYGRREDLQRRDVIP